MRTLLILFLLLPLGLCAQLNESDSLKTKVKLSLTGFWQGGNVETLIFRTKLDFSTQLWGTTVYKTQNSYVYQAFGGDKADEDMLSLNFLYFNPKRKVYPLVLGFVSSNFRREIDIRYLLGGGVSYQPYEKEKDWLKLSLTTEYEQTDFKQTNFNFNSYDGNSTIETWRATIWMNGRYTFFKEKMILTHEMYFQPSLLDSDNFRWSADIGVEFPIWDYLNFKINFLQTSERIVIEGQKQYDQFLTVGFTVKSYSEKPDKNP